MKSKIHVVGAFVLFSALVFQDSASALINNIIGKREIDVQSCKLLIKPSLRGEIMPPGEKNDFKFAGYSETLNSNGVKQRFGFSIGCIEGITDKSETAKNHGGYFDPEKKKWTAYYVDDQDKEQLSSVTHVYAITAVNGDGFARTTDDVVGDPRQRESSLSYCLFSGTKAICGEGRVMNLSDPKANFLPTVLNVLRSVEFIDGNPSNQATANASGAAPATVPIGK